MNMERNEEKKHILLIALGGIGFRHFQALLECESEFDLHVMDVSPDAVERARSYAEKRKPNKKIDYHSSISELEPATCFQIAIIATSSLPRRAVFEELIGRCAVRTVIFEKVLFPRIQDYQDVGALLKEHHISAYVNCLFRTEKPYQQIREELRGARQLHAQVTGGGWGLACNCVHMLDLFAYFSSCAPDSVSCEALLEDRIYDSKRKGYIEFYGKLIGRVGENTTYLMECDHSQNALKLELFTEKTYYSIDMAGGRAIKLDLVQGNFTEGQYEPLLISRSTTQIVDKLMRGQPIELSSYDVSAEFHVLLLREFLRKKNQIEGAEDVICPIT